MILILDVDGTLINYKGEIPGSARKAVNTARANGHKVFLCTGCSTIEVEKRNLNLELDGMIGGNGSYIEVNGEVIYHHPLSLEQCTHFVDWCRSRGLAHRLECNSGMYISEDYEEKSWSARQKYLAGDAKASGKPPMNPAMCFGEMYRDDVNKTAFVLNSYQDYLDAKEEFKDMEVGTWGGKGELALYGDTSPLGTSKYASCVRLLKYLNTDASQAIAFGDAKSDIPMFKACGYAVAMGNGGPEAKEAADMITTGVDEDGLFNAFTKLNLM